MKDFDNFPRLTEANRKSKEIRWGLKIFGDGIFLADGDLWKMQRHIASKLFRRWNLERMIPVFVEHGEKLISILSGKLDEEINVQYYFNRYTMDTFGEVGFGVSLNSMDSFSDFVQAFEITQDKAISNAINPYYWVEAY